MMIKSIRTSDAKGDDSVEFSYLTRGSDLLVKIGKRDYVITHKDVPHIIDFLIEYRDGFVTDETK